MQTGRRDAETIPDQTPSSQDRHAFAQDQSLRVNVNVNVNGHYSREYENMKVDGYNKHERCMGAMKLGL
jgi:hypothetical protein